jgi:hypothetical protein
VDVFVKLKFHKRLKFVITLFRRLWGDKAAAKTLAKNSKDSGKNLWEFAYQIFNILPILRGIVNFFMV